MTEWIPIAEKLIDLGHYWVTMQFLEALARLVSLVAVIGIVVCGGLFISKKIAESMDQ